MERRAAIVARVLSFEHSFLDRVRGTLDFVVVFKRNSDASEACAREWSQGFGVLASTKVQGRALTAVKAPYDPAMLSRAADAGKLEVIVVCPGLDTEAGELVRMSRDRRVLTVGDSALAVERHYSLGVVSVADKLQILVNLTNAKQEGVRLSSQVLRLAKVIR